MKRIYNQETKLRYLETLPENTQRTYIYAFYRSFEIEEMLDRDIMHFTTDEIKDALLSAAHTTINSVRLTRNIYENYISWAIRNGMTNSNLNVVKSIDERELGTLVSKKKRFLSEMELEELEDNMLNYQDKVVFRLIFEGVLGTEASELVNLTRFDINGNELTLRDDKYGERTITVSDKCIKFVEKAIDENLYHPANGNAEGKYAKEIEVLPGDHVVRNTKRGSAKSEKLDRHGAYRRITMIKNLYELPNLNPKNIRISGMIKMAKDLYERDGVLGNPQLAEVAEKYGVRQVTQNGYLLYNYAYLRENINPENIEQLYGVKIDK